ncbi:hypothetical protein MKX03_007237, partial [Papaver bracteatum]
MMNKEGKNMDLYIHRKCSPASRIITAKDHASVQLHIGHIDESGIHIGQLGTLVHVHLDLSKDGTKLI